MHAVVIGKNGQLAWELQQTCPDSIRLTVLGSEQLDVSQAEAVQQTLSSLKPDLIINASAYTAVDKAETDREQAFAINEKGALHLAKSAKELGARLLHVSTDFVFSGDKNVPYLPDDETQPCGVYGESKLAGERAVQSILPASSVIVRTAWVYSAHGNNFVKTILRLIGQKPELGVIVDQVGTPTWAKNLATWLWAVAVKPEIHGVFHFTDAGVTSWYDFAVSIQELGIEKGLVQKAVPINPIPAINYPLPAKRPSYSVLDKTTAIEAVNFPQLHWREQLSLMLEELKQQ